jgi:hypothetical protein
MLNACIKRTRGSHQEFKKSCKYKREIYKELRNCNKPILRTYYRNYSKIITTMKKTAKRIYCDKCIQNSHNKMKPAWDSIKKGVDMNISRAEINSLILEGKKISSQLVTGGTFYKCFANVADKVKRQIINNDVTANDFNNIGSYIDLWL